MENKYDSMSLAALKAEAKSRGIKNISILRKKELIDLLTENDGNEGVKNSKANDKKESVKKESKKTKKEASSELEETKEKKRTTLKKISSVESSESNIEIKESSKDDGPKAMDAVVSKADNSIKFQTEPGNDEVKKESSEFVSEKTYTPKPREMKPYNKTPYVKNDSFTRETKQGYHAKEGYGFSKDTNQRESYGTRESYGNKDNTSTLSRENSQVNKEYTPSSVVRDGQAPQNRDLSLQNSDLDSGETKQGILECLPDGYGFIRCDNYLPGENDVYVSPAQIRKFNLKTGDIIIGNTKVKNQNEKFSALLYVKSINGLHPSEAQKRPKFEDLTPIFPNKRIRLERPGAGHAMRMVDLVSPIGGGQRGMIVSPPKAGKTTLLKHVAKSINMNYPEKKLIILLIDERPEEVTDIKESIEGKNVEVIYSTFDELPENHKRVSEMVIERAKRLVEHKMEVVVLLDSITRLARAYNLTVQPSGRTLSGGLDPSALHMPKKFFGAARNMREGGSLTILATALVETGSRMDDVVFEEFKGTGNMELVLDRNLSEKRIFPAIDLARSSTRRDDLLLSQGEAEAALLMRRALSSMKSDEALERIVKMFIQTNSNEEFIEIIKKTKLI